MKYLIIYVLSMQMLFAFTATVKKDKVTLKINENIKEYKVADVINLNPGDIICFKKGKGRVVLEGDNYKKQLSKRTKLCKQLPVSQNEKVNYGNIAKNTILNVFAKSNEKEIDGISRKGALNCSVNTKTILIDKNNKYIQIQSNNWGPLPIKLSISDKNGTIIDESYNEEDINTSFLIPSDIIPNGGCNIKISNAFDEELVNSNLLKKVNNDK
jgi:hypothetical protein